jgi:aminoglycoside phosphotransferase
VADEFPDADVVVPAAVAAAAADQAVRLVWRNLAAEAERLAWAAPFHPVPRVIAHGADATGSWLVTAALPGENAVSPRWVGDPATAVRAIGAGLRALHTAFPVANCPFSWSAADRLADARREAAAGRLDPESWHAVHQPLGVAGALRQAADIPPADELVVCHGDACAPNTLLTPDGRWSGHVDFGLLGIADRWADIAVATWSADWNFGPGSEPLLLDAYGIEPDPVRTRYYRLLWDLSS